MATNATQSDPYAAIAQPASQPQTADPYAAIAQPASQPQGGGMGGLVTRGEDAAQNDALATPGEQTAARMVGGGVKALSSGVGGLADIYHWITSPMKEQFAIDYRMQHPQAGDQEQQAAWEQTQQAANHDHLKKAADWLREGTEPQGVAEHIGAIGEQALEYITGERLLGLAGRAGSAVDAAGQVSRAVLSTNRLKGASELASTLAKNPKAAGYLAIGIRAVQNAAIAGAQTGLHTEDPAQAGAAAGLGGAVSLALEPLAAAGRYLMRNAPQYVERLGQRFPVMKAQLNEAGKIEQGNIASEAPQLHEAQQAAMPGAIKNLAQRATANAISAINAARPVYEATTDQARLLEAPEGAEPFTFTLGTTPATEEAEGPLLQSPRKKQIGTKVIERAETPSPYGQPSNAGQGSNIRELNPETGEGPALNPDQPVSTNARRLVKEPQFQYLAGTRPGSPEPRTYTVGGGGTLQTTDAREATQWLTDLESLQGSEHFNDLPEAQQQAVNDHIKALNDQLGVYYSSPYAQRFGPEDLPGMLDKVRDFGDAQAQLEHAAKPVYAVMDRASGGEFTKWNNQYKLAQKVLRRPSTIEAGETAQARMEEASKNILGLIERHRGEVSFDDYQAAKNTWRQSSRLGEMHSMFERMMNGVTLEESDTGLTRLMKRGDVEGFERYLSKDENRSQIEQLIGKDGISNLKEMTGMFKNAKNNRAMQQVGRNVADYMLRRGWIARGMGGMVGGAVSHVLGTSPFEGTVAGMTAVEGLRSVLRYAAVNPRIGNMLTWAAQHDVDPRIYTPLIVRAMREPFDEQKQPEGQEEPAPAAQ